MKILINDSRFGKSNTIHLAATLTVGALLAAGAVSAQAQIISINIDNSTDYLAPASMDSADLGGAPGVRIDNWNSWQKDDTIFGDAGQPVVDSSGITVAGLTATVGSAATASRNNNTDNDLALYSDVWDVNAAGRTVSFSGVPYSLYDVYVYMYDDRDGRAGSFTIGSTTYFARGLSLQSGAEGLGNPASDGTGYVLSTDTDDTDGIDQANYVRFGALSGSSFDLELVGINAGNLDRNKVAGFQIVQVPEPATFALAGLGLAGLLIFRRRK